MDRDSLASSLFGASEHDIVNLFDSEDWSLFRNLISSANMFAEWGSGLSTIYAADQDSIQKVVSVETSPEWADKVSTFPIEGSQKIEVRLVDFGPVRSWGRPRDYSLIKNVWDYSSAPFRGDYSPDLILVDGRFRVHCFLEALLRAKRGTRIIFDDYVNRPWYHAVEKFILPEETCGRQASFKVKTKLLDRPRIKALSRKFSYVMD